MSDDPRKAKAKERSRKWYLEHRELVIARSKKFAEENPGKVRAYKDKWDSSNELHMIEYRKKTSKESVLRAELWAKANPEMAKASAKLYRQTHAEQGRVKTRKRRALRNGVPSERYTTEQILELYGTDCHICKSPIDLTASRQKDPKGLHLDHVYPISKGGADVISNVRPSHVTCNIRKHNSLEYVA